MERGLHWQPLLPSCPNRHLCRRSDESRAAEHGPARGRGERLKRCVGGADSGLEADRVVPWHVDRHGIDLDSNPAFGTLYIFYTR